MWSLRTCFFVAPLLVVIPTISACTAAVATSDFDNVLDDSGADAGETAPSDTAVGDSTPLPDSPGPDGDPPPPVDTGTPPPDADPPPTPGTVCDKLAAAACSDTTKSCCDSTGGRFDAAGCVGRVKSGCEDNLSRVKKGEVKYDETKVPACLDAWKALTKACVLPYFEFIRAYAVCDQVFSGNVPPGGRCSTTADCKAVPSGWSNCGDSGRCEVVILSKAGEPCAFSGAPARYCDTGLACYDIASGTGTCKAQKAKGEKCAGPTDITCGYGNRCADGTCKAGLAADASCRSDLDCASWQCSGGRCDDPNVRLVDFGICGG